ncbi:MAG TPA: hypothetical protein VNA89_09310 [Gemmatimonadaceae bacterium]|nr:hypothetical protein [Gemmatimonadaceae bacterium]
MDRHLVIPLAGMIMVCILAIGVPLVRGLIRRWELDGSGAGRLPAELGNRLTRLEQAVDAVAVEVERIAEGQRFTTRLLSERHGEAAASGDGSRRGA